jgi:hypothetical protein
MKADEMLPRYYAEYDEVDRTWYVYVSTFEEEKSDEFVAEFSNKEVAETVVNALNKSVERSQDMTKIFTQISNESFDLSYDYHNSIIVLTSYHDNGDKEQVTFYRSHVDDFYEFCKTFCEVFKNEL